MPDNKRRRANKSLSGSARSGGEAYDVQEKRTEHLSAGADDQIQLFHRQGIDEICLHPDFKAAACHSEEYEVLVSELLDICAEWRCFIAEMLMDKSRKSYMYHYDPKVLCAMMQAFFN